jgi:transcription termination/antitermination protein NusG
MCDESGEALLSEGISARTIPDGGGLFPHEPFIDPYTAWFAVRVRARSESVVASTLASRGYDCFTPTYLAQRQYSDRIRTVESALFTGYIFCRFNPGELLPILTTPGVQKVVSFGNIPEPVADVCIKDLRLAILHGLRTQPAEYLRTGQRVRVLCGALAGIEGFLVCSKDAQRLVITADVFCRAISIAIDRDQVVLL